MMQDWAKIQRSFKIYIVLNNKSVQVSRIEDSGKYPMRTGPTELLTLDDDDMMSPPSVVGIQMRVNISTNFLRRFHAKFLP